MATPQQHRSSKLVISMEDLFTSMKKQIEQSQYAAVDALCDQILSIAPGDEDALRCKVVTLIMDSRFSQALLFLHSLKNCGLDFGFLKAYCLYKVNKMDEALESLKGQEQNAESLVLESQILYRIGKADACADIYRKLQKSKVDLLEVNIVASLISTGRSSDVKGMVEELLVKPTSSYELAFNVACSLIEKNEPADAERLLLSARRIGQEVLMEEEDWDDDIIEKELAPLTVQLAYVQQLLGRSQEAVESYTNCIGRDLDDEPSVAVAVNNLITLKGLTGISDSMRRYGKLFEKSNTSQLNQGLDMKLSARQKEIIFANRVILLLHANRLDLVRELVGVMETVFPESVTPLLLKSVLLVRENKPRRAEEILLRFAETFPEKSGEALLARAQVAAVSGRPDTAAESLAMVPGIQHMPATLSTLVSLKEATGDVAGAVSIFNSEIELRRSHAEAAAPLFKEAAAFMLKHGMTEESFVACRRLFELEGSVGSLASLVAAAAARVDLEGAETYKKMLKPLAGVERVDIEGLEKAVVGVGVGAYNEEEVGPRDRSKKKRKRKRKPRYPKGFDPSNPGPPPDPERWLPKKERSKYRPKRKDKRVGQVRGSQGAVAPPCSSMGSGASTSKPSQGGNSKGRRRLGK